MLSNMIILDNVLFIIGHNSLEKDISTTRGDMPAEMT